MKQPRRNWSKTRHSAWLALGLVAFMAAPVLAQPSTSQDKFHDKLMVLGTGPDGGSFGPIGNTLCETLNEVRKTSLVRCVVLRSAGSVFNIFAVANGSLQLGFGQEDLIAKTFLDDKVKGSDALRTVALIHTTAALHRVDGGFDTGELIAMSPRIAMPPNASVVDMHKITSPVIAIFAVSELAKLAQVQA